MTRVMIVENAEKPLWLVKKLLTSINYEICYETRNGFEAIENYDIIKPDLVLLDFKPSKNDGISVLKQIKKNHPESRIIMLTTQSNPKIFEDYLNEGALSCISIPFKMKEFVSLLARIDQIPKIKTPLNPITIEEPLK